MSELTQYEKGLGYCEEAQTYCSVAEKRYKQGKVDGFQEALTDAGIVIYTDKLKAEGARKFAEWLCARHYFDGWYKFDGNEEVKLTTDEILAEWQKGEEE